MNNRRSIILMIAAMAGFSLEDLFVKKLSANISVGQILLIFGILSSLVFALIAKANGHNVFARHAWTRVTMARTFAEAIASVSFVISLSLVPLSTVAAVLQVTPLTITMGAALFLKEKVGWRRWVAITVGFFGVLLIIRPGFSDFDISILYVLISVLGFTIRDLITRIISDNIASSVVSFQAFASLIFTGILVLLFDSNELVAVNPLHASYFLGGVIFGVIGYYGLVVAMRIGDASIVSPFRYTRLLFSLIIGILVFSERPDFLTLLGAVVIVCTGVYTFIRERRIKQAV